MTDSPLTTLIAIITSANALTTAYIGVAQWRLARYQTRLDLNEKRFETYRCVTEFVSHICIHGAATEEEQIRFLRTASRNEFLFKEDVQTYVQELYTKAMHKSAKKDVINSVGADEARGQAGKEDAEFAHWFSLQFDVARQRFGRYLGMRRL